MASQDGGIDMENVKMFLFGRWISTCYADTLNPKNNLSILNTEDGEWWKEQLDHFNNVVYPNYIKNNTVRDTIKFLEK